VRPLNDNQKALVGLAANLPEAPGVDLCRLIWQR